MKTFIFATAASALALTGAACAPGGKAAARTALDCPATQGDLTRTSMAADRKTCIYQTSDGAEVSLQLIPVTANADATLRAIEATLTAPAPGEPLEAGAPAEAAVKSAELAAKDADTAAKDAAKDAQQAAAEAAGDSDSDRVDIDVPGVHVQAQGKTADGETETTHVHLPGIHIDAQEDDAQVRIGGMQINANGEDATVRIVREVRLRGEALSRERRGVRATFIYTGRNLPNGYRFVGYEAAGPKVGPLAVATVRSRTAHEHGDDAYSSVKRLVRRNGGV